MLQTRLPLLRLAPALLASVLVAAVVAVGLDLALIAVGAARAARALDRLGGSDLFLQSYLTAFWATALVALAIVGCELATVVLARTLQTIISHWCWQGRDERWLALAAALSSLPLWSWAGWSLLSGRWISGVLPGAAPRVVLALLLAALSALFVASWWRHGEALWRRRPRSAVLIALLVYVLLLTLDALVLPGLYLAGHTLLALAAGLLLQRVCWRPPAAAAPLRRRRLVNLFALTLLAIFLTAWPFLTGAEQEPLARFVVARFMPLAGSALRVTGAVQRLVRRPPKGLKAAARLRKAPRMARLRALLGVGPAARWPDVIVLSIDGLGPFRASAAGRSVSGRDTTPFLRRLAARALDYRRAYAPSSGTEATMLALLSGTWQRERTRTSRKAAPRDRLVARFRQLGYRSYCNLPFVERLRRRLGRARGCDVMVTVANARWSVDGLLHFLGTQAAEQPVFAWVHFTATHLPYERFAGFDFGPGREQRYDTALAGIDRLLGRAVARLETNGRPLRLVVTGDHGHAFGWHGLSGHNTSLYEDQLRVVLLLAGFPGAAARIDTPVSLLDLTATFAGGVGVDLLAARAPGWRRPVERPIIALHHRSAAIVVGRYKLIEDEQSGAAELYDVVTDPRERVNLIAREPALAARLRRRLRAHR